MNTTTPLRARGYTLGELIVTLVVLAVLTAIALPAWSGLVAAQRVRSASMLISSQFALARSTAITRQQPVSVCPSRLPGQCSGDADWRHGWMMYLDPARRSQPANAEAVLRQESMNAHRSLRILSSAGRRAIRFQPDGRAGGTNLRVRICLDDQLLRDIVVNNLGRIRTSTFPATAGPSARRCDG